MTNPTESKQQYEGAILSQLIKNSERLVVVERDIADLKNGLTTANNDITELKKSLVRVEKTTSRIEKLLGWINWIGGGVIAIALSLIANFVYSLVS